MNVRGVEQAPCFLNRRAIALPNEASSVVLVVMRSCPAAVAETLSRSKYEEVLQMSSHWVVEMRGSLRVLFLLT